MNLYSVNCGYFKLDGGAMFGVVPKTIWNTINPADENNMCSWAMRSLLIEDGNRLVLIDCGMGNKQSEKFFGYYYLHGDDTLDKSLSAHGFHRNDITDVFLTHLHFDHCGGAIERVNEKFVPAFKNAVYRSNESHWQWATQPNDREKASFLKENIQPIQDSGQLQFIPKEDKTAFTLNVKIRFVYGHTKAMMLPEIQYKNKTIVFVADLFPSAGHIPVPYIPSYDVIPLQSLQEKQTFLEEALEKEYILFFQHDPFYECCTVQQTLKGIRPERFFKLNEI